MLELLGLDNLFRLIGNLYVLLGLGLAALVAWRLPGRRRTKALGAAIVLALFAWYPVTTILERRAAAEAFSARRAQAVARMDELCKGAGEFIHRTAEGVDGLFLMKLRPTDFNERSQWAVDPYGRDGDEFIQLGKPHERVPGGYLENFLIARNEKGHLINDTEGAIPGFAYVDVIDPTDGLRYRYTGRMGFPPHLKNDKRYTPEYRAFYLIRERVTPDMPLPRYGVTYEDITEKADRARWWLAGSSLRVIDLETGEVMGERVAYMMDSQIGEGGSYTNWTTISRWGRMCPGRAPPAQTRRFVEQVIKPSKDQR